LRDLSATRKPIGEQGVWHIHDFFELADFCFAEISEPCAHESADQQIAFLGTAMLGAEFKAAAAIFSGAELGCSVHGAPDI